MKHPEHKRALHRYELDFRSLKSHGLQRSDVERLFRGLYVHSFGVFQLFKDIMAKFKHDIVGTIGKRAHFLGNVWRVYQILVEFCSPSDYKSVTASLEEKMRDEYINLNEKIS